MNHCVRSFTENAALSVNEHAGKELLLREKSMEMKYRKTGFLVCNILMPLLIGAMIYYLIAPDVIFVHEIEEILSVNFNRGEIYSTSIVIAVLRNYFLDMLWGYALVFALFLAFGKKAESTWRILVMSVVFSAVMEILQLTPAVSGTFDVLDIAVECLSELIAAIIIIRTCKP